MTVQRPVLEAVDAVATQFALDAPHVLMTKLGSKLYVEIDTEVDAHVTVGQQQDVRDELQRRLDALPYEVWLNIELAPRGASEASEATDPP